MDFGEFFVGEVPELCGEGVHLLLDFAQAGLVALGRGFVGLFRGLGQCPMHRIGRVVFGDTDVVEDVGRAKTLAPLLGISASCEVSQGGVDRCAHKMGFVFIFYGNQSNYVLRNNYFAIFVSDYSRFK